MDIFEELKQRAKTEIEWLCQAMANTDNSVEKYKYRKIKIGVEAMLEHIYQVEEKYKDQNQTHKPMTFGEKIRSMSDEELAELLSDNRSSIDYVDNLELLKSEAE